MWKKSLIHWKISLTRRGLIFHNLEDARLSDDSLALWCERWDPGTLAATQRYGRRKYLRTTCCRFVHMGELSSSGIHFYLCVSMLDILLMSTPAAPNFLWKFLCRLMCAMPIRFSNSMECQMKTLWSWCTMTLLTTLGESYICWDLVSANQTLCVPQRQSLSLLTLKRSARWNGQKLASWLIFRSLGPRVKSHLLFLCISCKESSQMGLLTLKTCMYLPFPLEIPTKEWS